MAGLQSRNLLEVRTKTTKTLRQLISVPRLECMASLIEALMLPIRRCNWREKHINFGRSVTGYISCLSSLRTHCFTVYLWSSIRWYTQRNSDLKRVEGSVESCSGNAHQRSDIRGNDSSPRSEQLAACRNFRHCPFARVTVRKFFGHDRTKRLH